MIKRRQLPLLLLGIIILLGVYNFSGPNNEKKIKKKPPYNQKSEQGNNVYKDPISPVLKDIHTYTLETERWGIYSDGSHAKKTTEGMNKALQWAQKQGYSTFYVPPGTYLISKGKSDSDPEARINLVSNMTFLIDDEAIIQKETNGLEIYSTLYLDYDVENVMIKGGTLRGDNETHDYSKKGEYTGGTHEWGNGITTAGARNVVVDGVKIKNFTGDGIEIGGTTIYGEYITEDDLELGSIDDKGKPVSQKGKIRSNNYDVTNFSHPAYKNPHYRNLMMWIPEGVEGTYDLFYYEKDGTFIKKEKNQRFNSTWGYSKVPEDADYYRVVFNANSTSDVKVNRMTVAITENMTIKNCDIGYNRRQGITVGASENINIIDNKIHHTKGTAPESGIDIEPGFYPAINTLIKGNQFLKNKIHIVFSYGGNATVEENEFGPNAENGIGFSINPSYYGAVVRNNYFEDTNFVTWGNTKFLNNKLISSEAKFEGGSNVVVDGVDGKDSRLGVTQTDENGIKVSNVKLSSSKKKPPKGGIYIYGTSFYMDSISLSGNNEIGGEGNSKNIYENISFINSPEMSPALGTYRNCSSDGVFFLLNLQGKIKFDQCTMKNTMIYTYHPKTEATIQDSTFNHDKSFTSPVFLALEAKKINLLNNSINVAATEKGIPPIIQIGRDASEKDPSKVFDVTIKGNRITASEKRIGIDTKNGGIGSGVYIIEGNTLHLASLNLREKDINRKNQNSQ
jgi:hypothetical protein